MDAIKEWFSSLGTAFGDFLPSLLAALAILIGGWLIAKLLSKGIEKLLLKTNIDNKLYGWVLGDEGSKPSSGKIEHATATVIFYALMIFVLIAFFQVLGVTALTEPLNGLLESVMVYLPRIGAAAVLALVAWAIATGLKLLVGKGLDAAGLDDAVSEKSGVENKKQLSGTLAEVAYWLVWLLFLPAILGALQLNGILKPIQGMVDKLVGYLPNLLLAAIIMVVGWFVARIVQRILTNLLAAAGVDSLAERVGVNKALGEKNASDVIGLVIYTLILIPIFISALQALEAEAITEPASAMLNSILAALPALFGAALILVISFIIGRVVAELVANLLESVGINKIPAMLGLETPEEGGMTLSEVARWIIMTGILLFASLEAADMLGFGDLSVIIANFIDFAGRVLIGLLIFALGIWLAQIAERAVEATARGNDEFVALAAKVAVIVMAGAMALRQMGLANEIVVLAFGLTFGALAIAFAIAFGVGGREIAGEELREWVKRRKKAAKSGGKNKPPKRPGSSASSLRTRLNNKRSDNQNTENDTSDESGNDDA